MRRTSWAILVFIGLATHPDAALRVEVLRSIGGLPPHIVGTYEDTINFQQDASGTYFVFDRRGHTVHTVDANKTTTRKVLEIGQEDGRVIQPTGFDIAPDGRFVVADVFAFLAEAARNRERWDLVISDPPSFAPSRRALPEALRAYRRLHRMCASVVEPAGTLCAASCSSHVESHAFVSSIEAGCADAGRRFVSQEHHGAGADHPILEVFPEGRYLKFTVGTVS